AARDPQPRHSRAGRRAQYVPGDECRRPHCRHRFRQSHCRRSAGRGSKECSGDRSLSGARVMLLLELKSVTAGYGGQAVLHEVSLTLERGEIVTLLGANGAGKSTLAKAISGLLRPLAGSILLEGEPIEALPPAERLRRGIAHVPEGR